MSECWMGCWAYMGGMLCKLVAADNQSDKNFRLRLFQVLDQFGAGGPAVLGHRCQGAGDDGPFRSRERLQVRRGTDVVIGNRAWRIGKRQPAAPQVTVGHCQRILIAPVAEPALEDFRAA